MWVHCTRGTGPKNYPKNYTKNYPKKLPKNTTQKNYPKKLPKKTTQKKKYLIDVPFYEASGNNM